MHDAFEAELIKDRNCRRASQIEPSLTRLLLRRNMDLR